MFNFIETFTNNCILNGKSTPLLICEEARKDLALLNEEISKIELLKIKQANLKTVIKQFGGNNIIKNKKSSIIKEEPVNNDAHKQMCVKVCDYIDTQDPNPVVPKQIIEAISSIENNKIVLTAILWLWKQNIIKRDDNLERKISKGKNWSDRPI